MTTYEEDIKQTIGYHFHIVEVGAFPFLYFFAETYIPSCLKTAVVGSNKHIARVWILHQFETDYFLGTDRLNVAKHVECFSKTSLCNCALGNITLTVGKISSNSYDCNNW